MNLIDAAKEKLGTYRAVATYLRVHETMVSAVRHGDRPLPPLQAGKLAELVGQSPAEAVFKALEEQAASNDDRRKFREWSRSIAAGLVGGLLLLPHATDSVAASKTWTSIAQGNLPPDIIGHGNRANFATMRGCLRGQSIRNGYGKRRRRVERKRRTVESPRAIRA